MIDMSLNSPGAFIFWSLIVYVPGEEKKVCDWDISLCIYWHILKFWYFQALTGAFHN